MCYSDIPGGKEPHDCFDLLECPYILMSTGQPKVTSDLIHTRWGSLSLPLAFRLVLYTLSLASHLCLYVVKMS